MCVCVFVVRYASFVAWLVVCVLFNTCLYVLCVACLLVVDCWVVFGVCYVLGVR